MNRLRLVKIKGLCKDLYFVLLISLIKLMSVIVMNVEKIGWVVMKRSSDVMNRIVSVWINVLVSE